MQLVLRGVQEWEFSSTHWVPLEFHIFGMDRYAKGCPECAVVTETHNKAVKF